MDFITILLALVTIFAIVSIIKFPFRALSVILTMAKSNAKNNVENDVENKTDPRVIFLSWVIYFYVRMALILIPFAWVEYMIITKYFVGD